MPEQSPEQNQGLDPLEKLDDAFKEIIDKSADIEAGKKDAEGKPLDKGKDVDDIEDQVFDKF